MKAKIVNLDEGENKQTKKGIVNYELLILNEQKMIIEMTGKVCYRFDN